MKKIKIKTIGKNKSKNTPGQSVFHPLPFKGSNIGGPYLLKKNLVLRYVYNRRKIIILTYFYFYLWIKFKFIFLKKHY